jgi:hypothetical protein
VTARFPRAWVWAATAGAYLALALVWSWPLPPHIGNRFTHDPGDPLLVTYLMWWNAHALPLTSRWWSAPFYWPLPDALALTEHLAGVSPLSTPIQLLGGTPLLAYNLVLLASIWWAGLAAHILVRRLTQDTGAAACAGVAFALAPYRTSQLGHLQLYACWWLPALFLALHGYYEDGRRRWLLLFGVAWLLQGLTNGYFLFFLPVLICCWLAWFTRTRVEIRRSTMVAATWLLFTIPIVPFLLKYYRVLTWEGLGRTRGDMLNYSAHFSAFLSGTPLLRYWKTPEPTNTELYLFPGVTVVALIVVAIVLRPRDRKLTFYAAAAILMAWFCAGPVAQPWSIATLWHPYEWLMWMPGLGGLRVPARFFMFATLCLATGAGIALSHILRRVRWRAAVCAFVFTGLWIDGAITGMPLGGPPGGLDIRERGARVLELPFADGRVSVFAMYRSMSHGMPVVNGYAGYVTSHADVIDWALNRRDPSILTELRRGHPLYVIVASTDQAPQWTKFMDAQHGAQMLGISGGGRVYRMAASGFAPQLVAGPALPARVRLDGLWLTADLGQIQTARMVELRTHGKLTQLPEIIHIESSEDGSNWIRQAEQPPGGPALVGALDVPRVIPIRLFVPDVRARFIRINTSRFAPQALTIYGP